MFVCLSVRLLVRMGQLGFHWKILINLVFENFRKSVEEVQVSLKSYKNIGYLI